MIDVLQVSSIRDVKLLKVLNEPAGFVVSAAGWPILLKYVTDLLSTGANCEEGASGIMVFTKYVEI
jgi:hypothetical protein